MILPKRYAILDVSCFASPPGRNTLMVDFGRNRAVSDSREIHGSQKSRRVWLLAGVLLLAVFFRFYHFTSTPPGLYADEAMDGNNAVEALQTGHFRVFYAEDNGREGLYVNLIAVLLKFRPVYEPWIIRLPAAIAGVLTVYGLYFLAAELFGYQVGLLAAFLLATSFWHVNFSRIGYRVILAPLLLIWSLFWLLKSLRRGSGPSSFAATKAARSWRASPFVFAGLAGILYGLGFYSYIAYRITPVLFLLFIPFFWKHAGFWKRVGIFILCTFLVAAPIGYHFLRHPADFSERTAQLSVTNTAHPFSLFARNYGKTLLMFNGHGDDNWGSNLSGSPELFWPVGILFGVGLILSVIALVKEGRGADSADAPSLSQFGLWLAWLWFLLAAIPPAATVPDLPSALRSLLMLPPAIIFAAIGGTWVYELVRHCFTKSAARVMATVFVIAIVASTYHRYFVEWASIPNVHVSFDEKYVEIGRQINALPAGTQKYVIVSAPGYLARGIPVPAETTMFITDSFTQRGQAEHHIRYLLPNQTSAIPAGTPSNQIFHIE